MKWRTLTAFADIRDAQPRYWLSAWQMNKLLKSSEHQPHMIAYAVKEMQLLRKKGDVYKAVIVSRMWVEKNGKKSKVSRSEREVS